MSKFLERIKESIKRNDGLYLMIFSLWALLYIGRTSRIFKRFKKVAGSGKKVLILGVRTIPTTNLVYFDAIFGHAFASLGHSPLMLYCGGIMPSCDADTVSRNQRPQCTLCRKFGKAVRSAINLPSRTYGEFIDDEALSNLKDLCKKLTVEEMMNYRYLGVNAGALARSAVIRFFLVGMLNTADPAQVEKLREKLLYALIGIHVASQVHEKERPDLVFMLHGIYSTWGSFFEYFRSRNIDVITYGHQPIRFGRFTFSRNGREFDLVARRTWEKEKFLPMTGQQKEDIDGLQQRFRGGSKDHFSLFGRNFDRAKDKNQLLEELSRHSVKRRYVMYTNLPWDACVVELNSPVFADIFEWIDVTIRYFIAHPEYQLIIKPHPAELIWEKCSKGAGDYIREHHELTPNIRLLPANTPLLAYDLISQDSVGITFSGTIGLEMAIKGIPFIVPGKCHYKEAGVVYPVRDKKDYLSLLDDPRPLQEWVKTHASMAMKYAHFYFFREMVRVPFYRDDLWGEIDWNVVTPARLMGPAGELAHICSAMLEGRDILENNG